GQVGGLPRHAGGLQDLVKDGRGIVCGKKNAGQLAAGIDLLLSNPQSGKEMVDNAYSYVCKYHSLEFITKQYLDIFT
ncbi:MAG: glycosyltransferase, partial [Chitinophagales bacterium]